MRFAPKVLSVVIPVIAIASLWYGRTYPPALTGTWSLQQNAPGSDVTLTLRAGGRGYLKYKTIPEQPVRWFADGDKITITTPPSPAVLLFGSAEFIATEGPNGDELSLDIGSPIMLRRTE